MGFGLVTGALVAGAASGAAGGLMKKGPTTVTPKFAKEDLPFKNAANQLIPFNTQLIAGQDPAALRRYLQVARSELQAKTGGQIQSYLSKVGQRGGSNFGPQAQAQIGKMYEGINPALAKTLTGTRSAFLSNALQQMQQWSQMKPTGSETETEQPSTGKMAAAGALQGLGRGLGSVSSPGGGAMGATQQVAPVPQTAPLGQGTTLGSSGAAQQQSMSPQLMELLRGGK